VVSIPDADNVGEYLISSRSAREYEAMFALTETDLRGRGVLDCPRGASSFTAAASEHGAHVIAVDPVYSLPTRTLRQLTN
jgi:predicted RNA methylase